MGVAEVAAGWAEPLHCCFLQMIETMVGMAEVAAGWAEPLHCCFLQMIETMVGMAEVAAGWAGPEKEDVEEENLHPSGGVVVMEGSQGRGETVEGEERIPP